MNGLKKTLYLIVEGVIVFFSIHIFLIYLTSFFGVKQELMLSNLTFAVILTGVIIWITGSRIVNAIKSLKNDDDI